MNATLVVAIAAALLVPAAPATASPDNSGCPTGYAARTLSEWAADGYTGAPPRVDDPANGGNGDTIVCGRPLGDGISKHYDIDFVIYQFRDNTVPA